MTSNDDNADDQPATVVGDSSDATTVVPPPTEAAPELAWSADSSDGENEGTTWLDRLSWVVHIDRLQRRYPAGDGCTQQRPAGTVPSHGRHQRAATRR